MQCSCKAFKSFSVSESALLGGRGDKRNGLLKQHCQPFLRGGFSLCNTLKKEGRAFQNIGKNISLYCLISLAYFRVFNQVHFLSQDVLTRVVDGVLIIVY